MANEQNLISPEELNARLTPEQRRANTSKAGIASVVPKNKPRGLWKTNTTSYIEVIGNIHENPELLEDKK